MAVQDSLRGESERALRRRDDRILAKLDRYRRNRNAAGGLAIVGALGVFAPFIASAAMPTSAQYATGFPMVMFAAFSNAIIWPVACYAFHARFQHAQSIAHCRRNHDRRVSI